MNAIQIDNFEVKDNVKKKKIAMAIYIFKQSLDNKYFYIKIQKKIFNIHNRKKLMRILDLLNQKKAIILVEQ